MSDVSRVRTTTTGFRRRELRAICGRGCRMHLPERRVAPVVLDLAHRCDLRAGPLLPQSHHPACAPYRWSDGVGGTDREDGGAPGDCGNDTAPNEVADHG